MWGRVKLLRFLGCGTPEWIRTTDLLLRSYRNPLLPLLLLLGFSTTWGVCFRSADILRGLNNNSIDTVLIRRRAAFLHSVLEVAEYAVCRSPLAPK
jgi:hypothetical protein